MLINQSLVKDLLKYQKKDFCGLVFENKWISKRFAKGTKSNSLGHYFEYLCTGALAKGDTEPVKPEYTKKGELTTDFALAQKQAVHFKHVISTLGIKLLSAGEKVVAEDKWVGTLDIKARWDSVFDDDIVFKDPKNPENIVIIDLKYSGLLEDKWSEFGWHNDTLHKKWGTMLQAKHYKFLFWKKYGFNPPFFFFVFDNKKEEEWKIIYVDINEEDLETHELFLNRAKIYLDRQIEKGFKPLPRYDLCKSCSYKKWCAFKVEMPPIVIVKPD